jgi:hypothetical protein
LTDLIEIKQNLAPALVRAQALSEAEMVVKSQADEITAAEVMKLLHQEIRTLENKRKEITDPMNAALKSVRGLFEEPLGHLSRAKAKVQSALSLYRTEIEARKAEQLDKALDHPTADAQRIALEVSTAPATVLAGVRETTDYEIVVEDPAKVPAEFLVVDVAAIRKAVKAAEGRCEIPGVRFTAVKKLSPTGR